jgi:hypothetical protein
MKKNIFLILLLGFVCQSYAQNIYFVQLTPTAVSQGINVNVQGVAFNGTGYLSHSYTVTGDVIDLTVCYWFDNTLPIIVLTNDFLIPLVNYGDYTINVQIMTSTSNVTCDNFSNPYNGTTSMRFLSNTNFTQNTPKLYPNPTDGILNIEIDTIEKIILYDLSGKQLKEWLSVSQLDVTDFSKGIYLIKLFSQQGVHVEKIIIK